MVTQSVLEFFGGLLVSLLGSLPAFPVPEWVGSGASSVATLFGGAASLGAWFPFGLVGPVLVTVVGALAFGLTVRVARLVLSLISGGGGA